MISIANPIWGFRKTTALPIPFEKRNSKCQTKIPKISADGIVSTDMIDKVITVSNSVIKAVIIMAALQEKAAGKEPNSYAFSGNLHEGIAIGTRTNSGKKETVYVEYPSRARNCTDIIKYDPNTGSLSGVFVPMEEGKNTPYKLEGAGSTDGTAIFLAMFDEIMTQKDYISSYYYDVVKPSLIKCNEEDVDYVWECLGTLNYMIYKEMTDFNDVSCLLADQMELPIIAKTNIKNGYDGPSKGKVTYGSFKILKEGKKDSTASRAKKEKENFKKVANLPFVRKRSDFSEEELAMIPIVKKEHVVSEEEKFILSEIVDTFSDELNCIKTIMLLGQSSSGKSHLAKTLAARMERPFSAPLTCTPNMDETSLLGTTLPVIESGKDRDYLSKEDNLLLDKIYSSTTDEEIRKTIKESLGIPSSEMILYDPDSTYQMLTGKKKEKVEPNEIINLVERIMLNKMNDLVSKVPKNDGVVKYKYYKSPLVRAIENGWMIEIQEFNVVKEAAMFTSLNNVFDKDSNGILETPYGQVLRHPDFRAIYTANPDYAGCRDPHQSVIARSDMIVTMNNPVESVMKERVKKRMKFEDNTLLTDIVRAFNTISERAIEIGCTGEATMRELYRFASAINRNVDKDMALENYLLNSITRDEEDKAELREAAKYTDLFRR